MNFAQIVAILMFFLAFFGLITSRNIVKSIICLVIKETSAIVFFLGLRFREGILPPIGESLTQPLEYIADPLPQALMITAIIIGLAVTAVDIIMLIYLTHETGSTDWDEVKAKTKERVASLEYL